MSQPLQFYVSDVYPNMGYRETSTDVQPDAEDQNTLVDDGNTAQGYNSDVAGSKFKVLGAVGLIFGVAVLLSFLSN